MAPFFFWRKLTKFWLLKGRSSEWKLQRPGNIIQFWFPFWNSICKCIFTMYLISRNRWLGDVHWGRILAVELNGIQIRCGADTLRYLYMTQIWGRSILLSTASRLIATITMSKIIIMIKPWILNASESKSETPSPTGTRGAYLLLNFTIAFGHASGRGWSIQFEQQCTTTASYPFVGDVVNYLHRRLLDLSFLMRKTLALSRAAVPLDICVKWDAV